MSALMTQGVGLAAVLVFSAAQLGCTVGDDQPLEDSQAGEGLGLDEEPNDPLAARVCATGETVQGIDVSKWQGTIDWARVKDAGVEYAFIRVSDGVASRDGKFAANWAGAKANGILRGAYQFFRPAQNIQTQAQLMIDAIGGTYTPGDLPPVIDVEADGGLSPATVAARIKTWVDKVEGATGVKPIVYTGKYFWRDEVGGPTDYVDHALWIAQYTSLCPDLPAPWPSWTFWQYTDRGRVDGITGPVDMNRFNGTLDDLKVFASVVPPAPAPTPDEPDDE